MFKKIVLFLFFIFYFGNVFAKTQSEMLEEQTKGMDTAADIVAEQNKAFEDSSDTTTSESTTTTSGKSENSSDSTYSGPCNYTDGVGLSSFLNGCKPKTLVGSTGEQMTIEGGFRNIINEWIVNISLVLGVLAVGSLVYAAMLMQFSGGEDELIKKSKNIIKWTIIGFILLISASGIVYVVVNVMFGLGE